MKIFSINMTALSFFFIFVGVLPTFLSPPVHAEAPVMDPNISHRCRDLLDTRSQKIDLKQKAQSMQQRVSQLKTQVGRKKVSEQRKLDTIKKKIDMKLRILNLEISHLEEDIVRKGCPGIKL